MKLFVVGATGPTGQLVVSQGLERGHQVVAFVRNPDKLTVEPQDGLKVIKGNLLDSSDLAEHMAGCDVVLSAVGGRGGMFNPCDIYSTSGQALLKAMKETGVKRIVVVTAWGTQDDPNLPFIIRWVLKPAFLRNIYKDMALLEEQLRCNSGDVVYTVVRPPQLTNEPATGQKVLSSEGQFVVHAGANKICRQDLAKFMLDTLSTTDFDNKMVAVVSEAAAQH